jgi:hypothetical protein
VAVGAVLVIALVIVGVVLFGSNDDQPSSAPPPGTAPSSVSPSTSPSPTTTPTPTASPEQLAVAGATAGYKAWRTLQDRIAMSGGTLATETLLASVATGNELNIDRYIANTHYKARGRKMVRPGVVVAVKPVSIGVPDANGNITAVTLSVCRDVRKADILQNGKSTKTADSPTHLIDTAKMTLDKGRWKALDVRNKSSNGGCS